MKTGFTMGDLVLLNVNNVTHDIPYTYAVLRYEPLNNGKFFVSAEIGSWDILTEDEFNLLKTGRVHEDPELFKRLEKKGLILTSRNMKDIYSTIRRKKQNIFTGPSLHIVAVTLRCNQKCLYCHALSRPEDAYEYDMDEDTAKEITKFIFQTPAKDIVIEFQGGEPLLNLDAVRTVHDTAVKLAGETKKFVSFALVSNMTLMDEDIATELFEERHIGLATSLDGPKEVHDKNRPFRKGKGSAYEKATYWIEYFWDKYRYVVNAMPTITKYTLPYWKELVEEYVKRHQYLLWIRHANYFGYAKSYWQEIGYTPQEFMEFWTKVTDYIVELNAKGKAKMKEGMSTIALKKLFGSRDPMYTDWMSPCGAITGQLAYDHNGNIYTCDEGRSFEEFRLGNVKEMKMADIFNHPLRHVMVSASSLESYPTCEVCAWKPWCGTCPVAAYSQYGTVVPPMPCFYKCYIHKNTFKYVIERWATSEKHRAVFEEWLTTPSPI